MKKTILLLSVILGITAGTNTYAQKNATIVEAKEILGNDFLSPEDVLKVFGVMPKQELPFTKEELLEMKRLGLMLFPQINKDKKGKPLTAKSIVEMFDNKFSDGEKILILFIKSSDGSFTKDYMDWCKNEDFYIKDPLKIGWRVISKNVLKEPLVQNYDSAITKAEQNFFKNSSLKINNKKQGVSLVEMVYSMVLLEKINGYKLYSKANEPYLFVYWVNSVFSNKHRIMLSCSDNNNIQYLDVYYRHRKEFVNNVGILPSFLK